MNSLLSQFGKKVRKQRESKNLSQEELADLSGLHRTYISSLERGHRNVSLVNIYRLAKALECDLNEFFNKIIK